MFPKINSHELKLVIWVQYCLLATWWHSPLVL